MANRKSKVEVEREKQIQDRLQVLLTAMLKEDDNKYCVDCDSKGPRWASWNLGIFLCIRCAGIHRNLGVHISKVKSVNLDSWTPLQVASMQLMGNSRARAVYEASLPDDHRRPHTDDALKTFIQTKYDQKSYIAREWQPTKPPDFPDGWVKLIEAEKQKKDIRKIPLPSHNNTPIASATAPTSTIPEKPVDLIQQSKPLQQLPSLTESSSMKEEKEDNLGDLLGLSTNPVATHTSNVDLLGAGEDNNDGFDSFVSANNNNNGPSTASAKPEVASASHDLFATQSSATTTTTSNASEQKMSNDSIMALFGQNVNPPTSNVFGGQTSQQQSGTIMFGNASAMQQANNPFLIPGQTQSMPANLNSNQVQQPFGKLRIGNTPNGSLTAAPSESDPLSSLGLWR